MVNYRPPGFLSKFLELQQVMWITNKGLTERHAYDSRPSSWPTLKRGINFWVKDHRQIYLIGNPFIWWLSTASVAIYAAARGFLILRAKRGYKDFNNTVVVKYDAVCGFLALGWFLHYFPFFLMQRQLFLHHYFPALYYAILLSCGVFDLLTLALRPRVRLQIAGALLIVAIWNYQHFSPLTYGGVWTKSKCTSSKWVKTWDFSCNEFLDNTSQYATVITGAAGRTTATSPPKVTIGGEGHGRPAVIVEDVPRKPVEEHTSSVHNPIEPGPNVFDKPQEEVTSHIPEPAQEEHSDTRVNAPPANVKDKEPKKPEAPVELVDTSKPAPAHVDNAAAKQGAQPAPKEPAGKEPVGPPPKEAVMNQPAGPAQPAAPVEAAPPKDSPAASVQKTNPPKKEHELTPEEKMEEKLRHELFPDAA
jgi:dolichyl-phosphate-mannose-protein mannosyltransferase